MVHEVISDDRLSAMPPAEAAALWLVRRSEGLSDGEERLFQAWKDRTPENAQAWADADRAMRCFEEAGDDEILGAMRAHALAAEPSSWFRPRMAAAAAVVMLLLAGALLFLPSGVRNGTPPAKEIAAITATYVTARAESRIVTLPDGSRMTLDAESAAETRFAETSRAVRLLRGRAFFDAATDPRRPFSVDAGARQVVALGTRFDVLLRSGELRVTLVEGKVSISTPGSPATASTLRPGQQFVEHGGTATIRTEEQQVEAVLDWQQGFVTFENDTLLEAAAEINRHSEDQLIVRDPAVGGLRVTGRFRSGDAERFGRVLADIHPIDMVRRRPNQLELVARD